MPSLRVRGQWRPVEAREFAWSGADTLQLDIAPVDDADIFIVGSGDVRLHTHPKHLNSRVAGSGQVIELARGQAT